MSNLYEINEQINELAEQLVDLETGEINEGVERQLNELQMERESKIEYLALKVKNLRADAGAIRAEVEKLIKRAETITNKADRIEQYIGNDLKGEEFSTSKVLIKWRKSKRVEIVNEAIIPDEYIKYETKGKVQKSLIKKAIEGGEEVAGATLTIHNNMRID